MVDTHLLVSDSGAQRRMGTMVAGCVQLCRHGWVGTGGHPCKPCPCTTQVRHGLVSSGMDSEPPRAASQQTSQPSKRWWGRSLNFE